MLQDMCVIIAKNKEGEDIEDCLFKDISINHNKDGVDDDFNVDIDSGNDDNDCINSDDINCNSDEYIDEYTDDGKMIMILMLLMRMIMVILIMKKNIDCGNIDNNCGNAFIDNDGNDDADYNNEKDVQDQQEDSKS